jgi:hypothetical protein
MSYEEIFILGWNLNALMFVVNLLLAIRVVRSKGHDDLERESQTLAQLKEEFDQYYPNRKYETMGTYLIPFTAFFRMNFRILEMVMFFVKNKDTSMYDFMVYKYTNDILRAKNVK